MPSLSFIKRNYGAPTNGVAHKNESDMIMEATWWSDIASRTGYLYDWYRDDYKTFINDLHPDLDSKKIPIDIKYLKSSSQTFAKDPVTFHIQLLPHQKCNVDYYEEFFAHRYNATFPCGLYIDIADNEGVFNRWLVVGLANNNDAQFPTYEILRCDYVFQWIHENVKYNMAGVLRSQSSYNSGVWLDYKVESQEDQQKFIVPLNRDSEHLFYNTRMIIDAPVVTEPRAWVITKVNRLAANGLVNVTLAQNRFDQIHDEIEKDDFGNVIGMWADAKATSVDPIDYEDSNPIIDQKYEPVAEDPKEVKHTTSIVAKITYPGSKPQIKIGGNKKTFTVKFYEDDNEIAYRAGSWNLTIDGVDVSSDTTLLTMSVVDNQMSLKFVGNKDNCDKYIGKTITVGFASYDLIKTSIDMEIIPL